MLTMRQIERWWTAKSYTRLIDELCAGRAEGVNGIRDLVDGPIAAAALTIIRTDELRQTSHPLVGKLIGLLLRTQNAAGGWEDGEVGVVTTALAARALAATGTGEAVDHALNYLADAQTTDGDWAVDTEAADEGAVATLIRTATVADMAVTAFVLYQLATIRRPAAALIIDGALASLLSNEESIDRPMDRKSASHKLGDAQLNTLRRRIKARRVLAAA